MHLAVTIPEPCHQDWEDMQARNNGRHCNACQKTVVDFTGWEAGDILDYLKNNQKTCGRFTADQLQQAPQPMAAPVDYSWLQHLMQSGLSHVGKIAAAVVLCFHLASCGSGTEAGLQIATKPQVADIGIAVNQDKTTGAIAIVGDTLVQDVAPPPPPVPKPPKEKIPEPVLLGEPAIVDPQPVVPEPPPQIMGGPMIVPHQDSIPGIRE